MKITTFDNSQKRIVIEMRNGDIFQSDWFDDDTSTIENNVNATKKELFIKSSMMSSDSINDEDIRTWYINKKRDNDSVYISQHALDRIKERCGLNKKAAVRMVQKIWDQGTRWKDFTAAQKKFVRERRRKHTSSTKYIIYGEYVYIFQDNILVTVYKMPNLKQKRA